LRLRLLALLTALRPSITMFLLATLAVSALVLSLDVAAISADNGATTALFRHLQASGASLASGGIVRKQAGSDCIGNDDADCIGRYLVDGNVSSSPKTVSSYFQWETSMWSQRSLKANITLDIDAFDTALLEASENICDLGITATVFNNASEQVYQRTVGTKFNILEGDSPFVDGWTGNTTFALYSNSKIFATVLYLASIVDAGKGYLDEPVYETFPEYLTPEDRVGKITPRMILSHRSGIKAYNRNDADDPLYQCIYNVTTTLDECIQQFLLNDDALLEDPGTIVAYNNDPFYILAEVILRKTGYDTLDQVLSEFITEPLGINATYDCPLVKSTSDKPHVSWGICSTGEDVPKLIQVLANQGSTSDGTQIVSADSVKQILSFQAGVANNADTPLSFAVPLNNCISRDNQEVANSLIGYGLGTMITAGVKGQLFVHASTVGGYWVIAPNKYSAYFAFMIAGAFPSKYTWMARVIDRFEKASTFQVSNTWEDEWNEITTCVDGMFIESDILDQATVPAVCPGEEVMPSPLPSNTTSTSSPSPSATPSMLTAIPINMSDPATSSTFTNAPALRILGGIIIVLTTVFTAV